MFSPVYPLPKNGGTPPVRFPHKKVLRLVQSGSSSSSRLCELNASRHSVKIGINKRLLQVQSVCVWQFSSLYPLLLVCLEQFVLARDLCGRCIGSQVLQVVPVTACYWQMRKSHRGHPVGYGCRRKYQPLHYIRH